MFAWLSASSAAFAAATTGLWAATSASRSGVLALVVRHVAPWSIMSFAFAAAFLVISASSRAMHSHLAAWREAPVKSRFMASTTMAPATFTSGRGRERLPVTAGAAASNSFLYFSAHAAAAGTFSLQHATALLAASMSLFAAAMPGWAAALAAAPGSVGSARAAISDAALSGRNPAFAARRQTVDASFEYWSGTGMTRPLLRRRGNDLRRKRGNCSPRSWAELHGCVAAASTRSRIDAIPITSVASLRVQ
mmetsp:Transcript_108625/g.307178  ORF Transcript_108625/g.307178 Transcript_108625/m.307178 type:complete len:250 (+) Transcript_108625:238-987(+)